MFHPDEPFFLQWHITDRCNLNCTHCYRQAVKPELSFDRLTKVFENFQRLRWSMHQKKARVQIAGGEPLLSDHLFDVLDLIAREGYQSRILSNGTLVDLKTAKRIKGCGCSIVQISLDGSNTTHDAIRGQGNYRRAIEGARCLAECGIQVTFAMTLTRQNRCDIQAVFDAAKQYAHRVSFHRLVPCGRGAEIRDQLLSPQEIQSAFDEIWKFKQADSELEVPLRDPLWKPYLRCPDLEPYANGCSVGYGGLCLESNGDVYPCRRMPIHLGNALTEELTDLWNTPLMDRLRNRDLLEGRCGCCSLRWKCGGCRAVAWAQDGDMLAEDPQCFAKLSFSENLAYNLINLLNRKAYRASFQDGG